MREPPVVHNPPPQATGGGEYARGRHASSGRRHRPKPGDYVAPPTEYVTPWIVGLVVAGLGYGEHWLWGSRLPDAAWAAAATLGATAGLTALTWGYSAARVPLLRWHTTAVTAVAGLMTMVTLVAGYSQAWAGIQGFGLVVVCASWNIRRIPAVRGEGRDAHGGQARSGLDELLGLPGASAKIVSVDGPRREAEIRTVGGQDYTDVQAAARKINAMAGLPPNSTRAVADPDDSSRARMVMVTEDVLRNMLPWPGPSAPGQSIAAPLRHGLYEDGLPAQVWLPGNWSPDRPRDVDPRNAIHLLMMGMSGAGKTITALILATEILTRTDAVLIWVDCVKGVQSAGPIQSGVACFVTDRAAAKQLFVGLRAAVAWRAQWLGQAGYREWWPGCGLPYLVVWVEEATQAIPDGDVITRLTESMRSVGMSLVLSMQRASADNIPSSARANMGASMCFGVNDKTGGSSDAGFALSEETIAAGARPEAWGTAKPGYHYLEAPGVPPERWSTKARSFYEDDAPLASVVAQWAHVRAVLDPGTADAIGDVFTAGQPGTTASPAGPAPAPTRGAPVRPYDEDDSDDDGEWQIPEQPEPAMAATIDPRAPIPEWTGPDIDMAPADDGRRPLTPDDRMTAFKTMLSQFMEAGRDEVQMSDLVGAWDEQVGPFTANQRPHLHAMLNALIELGQVERAESGRGRYRLCLLVSSRNGHGQ